MERIISLSWLEIKQFQEEIDGSDFGTQKRISNLPVFPG